MIEYLLLTEHFDRAFMEISGTNCIVGMLLTCPYINEGCHEFMSIIVVQCPLPTVIVIVGARCRPGVQVERTGRILGLLF